MADKYAELVAPWRAVLEAHRNVVKVLTEEMDEATGLPLAWYEVLLHLEESERGRLRMHELADLTLLSRSAVTRFVDRMETADLVERVTCPEDGRGLELVMTDDGRELFTKAGRVHLAGIKQHFLALLNDDEAATIREAMARVTKQAQSVTA